MQRWEYKTFKASRDDYKGFFKGVKDEKFEKDINKLGQEGWEMVGINGSNEIYFKRKI